MHFRVTKLKMFLAKGRCPLATPTGRHTTTSQGIRPSKMLLSSDLQAISYNFVVTFNKIQTKWASNNAFSGHKVKHCLEQSAAASLRP